MSSGSDEIAKIYDRMEAAASDGGYKYPNQELLDELRGVVWDIMKQIGRNIMQGKNLTSISLPVRVCEPRSYLQRITDGWIYAPIFLQRASEEKDAVERLKWVMVFALAGLWNTGYPKKPFNPILGETFQARYEDGTDIRVEQASHHPPITTWQMRGPNDSYHFFGYGAWSATFKGHNTVRGHQDGPHFVEFSDGTKIEYNLPDVFARGVIYGDQLIEYDGPMVFRDTKNGLECNLKINTGKYVPKSSGWFSGRKKAPSDYFEGEIMRKGASVCKAAGSWVGCVEFDGKAYWTHTETLKAHTPIPIEEALPSDCRHRKDMLFLKEKETDIAQDWKVRMEEEQRRDAKLREQGKSQRQARLADLETRYNALKLKE